MKNHERNIAIASELISTNAYEHHNKTAMGNMPDSLVGEGKRTSRFDGGQLTLYALVSNYKFSFCVSIHFLQK